ncbi:MAG TPA: helix-turn-helix domain-containing protein [Solirubrobacterales bacterium]
MRGQVEARAALAESLRAHREEVVGAALARTYSITDARSVADPEYAAGLRAAVDSALEFAIEAIEHGQRSPPPIPDALLAQVRRAARNGIALDTVLRRYLAGYTIFLDFLAQRAEEDELLTPGALQGILRSLATPFNRLVAVLTDEYNREAEERTDSAERRRLRCVERLLAGDLADPSELAYELEGHHLGIAACGPGASSALREAASALQCRVLIVTPDERTVWAWFGSRRGIDPTCLEELLAERPPHSSIALAEPADGLGGWRLTHRQAKAVLPIALRSPGPVRYRDAALLTALCSDDLLATSLQRLYLAPLAQERDDGAVLRQALRAYFDAGQNVSSAAAALGVDRHTLANRLRLIEELVANSLADCAAEMSAVLRMEELGLLGEQ